MPGSSAPPLQPRISVVIACHDEPGEFLRECLQSVLAQTFPNWEGIVIDDASTTGHAQVVVHALGDPRVRVIRHSANRGLGASRNSGIRAARTDFIALLDADDRLHPEFLEATMRALHEHPAADWAVADWQVFGTRDEVWPLPIDTSVNCPAHFLFVGAGAVMRKTLWEQVGGYAEDGRLKGGEDWDFWITTAERGLTPHHVPRPLYQYRLHPEAMSRMTSPHNEYVSRRMIYRRHRSAFQFMGLDCPKCASSKQRVAAFLAQGCLVSSYASLNQGERLRALWLAVSGLAMQPRDRALLQQLARTLLPRRIWSVVRRITRARSGTASRDDR